MNYTGDLSSWSTVQSTETGDTHPEPERAPEPAPAEPQAMEEFPWPPREGESVLSAFFQTWRQSTFEPARFFRAMPVPAPVLPTLAYFLVISVAASGIYLFWQSIWYLIVSGLGLELSGAEDVPSFWWNVVFFLVSPVFALIALLFAAGVNHLFLLMFGGAKRGFTTTMRVLAYTAGPSLFVIIPVLGGAIASIWGIVLAIIGLREAHRTDSWRTTLAVLLPVGIAFLVAFLATVAIGILATTLQL